MYNLFSRFPGLLPLLLLASAPLSAQVQVNLSAKTTAVSASVNAATVSLVNDGNRSTFWNSCGGETGSEEEYIEMTWDRTNDFSLANISWAVSGDTVALPTEARLAYWDGTSWTDGAVLPVVGSVSKAMLSFRSSRVRIYMRGMRGCGITEARIFGVQGEYDPTVSYEWPVYPDVMNYDFRRDYPDGFPAPTRQLPEQVGQVGSRTKGWWTFAWGKNRNHYVTDAAIDGILERMDHDFRFFREEMGWLPDKRAKNGYYSTIYLYGSGLSTDNADSTALGGWQGSTWYDGQSWPMVNLSYYPVACFDSAFTYDKIQNHAVTDQAFQTGACVHEGIHCMLADLDGCKKSVWFHESSDNWLMSEAEQRRTGVSTPSSMGFLSAGSVIAPFMPIDCYSGWLQDGSFGGPTADGVNMYGDKGQLCTWRRLLGGVQYSEYFPNALSQMLGNASIPWIWQNCRDYILESMGRALGDRSMRTLIMEYNARRAMVDVGKWNMAITNLLDNNWLLDIGPEGNAAGGNWLPDTEHWRATCYAPMYGCDEVDSAGWWKPEARTTPGWSAANQIPIHVSGEKGDIVRIYFKPLGANMSCQLCYRSKRGKVYYAHPVEGEGVVSIELKEVPANKIVMAVVSNTDYIYKGEETRKAHYDYRLRMMDHAFQPADPTLKWYKYRNTIIDKGFATAVRKVETDGTTQGSTHFTMWPERRVVKAGEQLALHFTGVTRPWVQVRMYTSGGTLVHAQSFRYDGGLAVPSGLARGLYILESSDGTERAVSKVSVE